MNLILIYIFTEHYEFEDQILKTLRAFKKFDIKLKKKIIFINNGSCPKNKKYRYYCNKIINYRYILNSGKIIKHIVNKYKKDSYYWFVSCDDIPIFNINIRSVLEKKNYDLIFGSYYQIRKRNIKEKIVINNSLINWNITGGAIIFNRFIGLKISTKFYTEDLYIYLMSRSNKKIASFFLFDNFILKKKIHKNSISIKKKKKIIYDQINILKFYLKKKILIYLKIEIILRYLRLKLDNLK